MYCNLRQAGGGAGRIYGRGAAGIFKISRNCANGTRNIDCGGLQAAGSNVVFDGRRIGS